MKIVETDIPDVVKENIDKSKIALSENIMKNVYPLFDEIYNSQIEKTKDLKDILKSKKAQVFESKGELEGLIKKVTQFFKEYIENCNKIGISLEKIKDIIKIRENENNKLLDNAKNIIKK